MPIIRFGAVAGRVPVNAFNKLGAVMTDLIMSFQQIMAPLANFFANILGNMVPSHNFFGSSNYRWYHFNGKQLN